MTQPTTPEDTLSRYGFVTELAKAVPEIAPMVDQAVTEQWTPERFQRAIAGTNWWKTTSQFGREWTLLTVTSPTEAQTQLSRGAEEIRNRAVFIGTAPPDAAKAQELWMHGKIAGLGENELDALIWRTTATAPGPNLGGRWGELVNDVHKQALAYGYNPPTLENEIFDFANYLMQAGGKGNTEGWTTKMKAYAKAKYSAFAEQIDGGMTMQDIAKPYMDRAKELLERNDITINDKVIQAALQARTTDGKPTAMPVYQMEREIRKDPRYQTTQNGREAALKYVQEIGKRFGMVAD